MIKFLRALLVNNIVLKITALILAVFAWSYIGGQLYMASVEKEREAPSIIKVSGEQLVVKTLPIYVNVEGEPAKGYRVRLDRISIAPSSSVVAGSPEAIKDVAYINTEPISIQGVNGAIVKDVKLTTPPNCKLGYEGLVRVTIPIVKSKRR